VRTHKGLWEIHTYTHTHTYTHALITHTHTHTLTHIYTHLMSRGSWDSIECRVDVEEASSSSFSNSLSCSGTFRTIDLMREGGG